MFDPQVAKTMLVEMFGLERDALHVYVGLTVYLLTAILFRLKLSDLRAVAAVFLAAVAGELVDLFRGLWPGEMPPWQSTWHDVWNTMFWPTVLCLLARFRRLPAS